MKYLRFISIIVALSVGGLSISTVKAAQSNYPQKPITFIISYAVGGGGDSYFRPLIDMVSAKLGVPIMIVNKGGGGGSKGLRDILAAKPDGYTIGNMVALSSVKLMGVSPYNQRDVDMIGVVNTSPTLIVSHGKKPWKSVKEMIDYAKSHPGEVTVVTTPKGSHQWITTKVFESAAKIKLLIVPEPESGGGIMAKIVGGHTDLAISALGNLQGQLFDAGILRMLAVLGSTRLEGKFSNVSTVAEQGFEVPNVEVLRCVLGPKGMPKPIRDKLIKVFGEAAKSEEYKKFMLSHNASPLWIAGEEGVKAYDEQEKVFRAVLEEAGLLKAAK
jgi:tripartite-type tricarboxylate transporter receptor subunit TctC